MIFAYLVLFICLLFLSNCLTAMFYRMPKGITIDRRHKPQCSLCGKNLPFPLYLPIVGYIISKGLCLCKKHKIPSQYTVIELITTFFTFTIAIIGDHNKPMYVMSIMLMAAISLLFFIEWHNGFHLDKGNYVLATMVSLYYIGQNILVETLIYKFTFSALFLSIFANKNHLLYKQKIIQLTILSLISQSYPTFVLMLIIPIITRVGGGGIGPIKTQIRFTSLIELMMYFLVILWQIKN